MDLEYGAFSALWGNNPDNDLATPDLIRDRAKEDMIFERLDQWIWSLRHDKPPAMADVEPSLALKALANICGPSQKYEKSLRGIAALQDENTALKQKLKENEAKIDAHSVRIAELMKAHEHGVLTTTTDKLLVDFVTRVTRRVDSGYLKKEHPSIYEAALKTSESRKVKVSVQPA